MSDKAWTDRLNVTVNILVLGVLAFALVRPSGPVGRWLGEYRERAAQREAIAGGWVDLVDGGARLDDGDAPVGLIEFADYECPACRMAHDRLEALAEDLGVGIVVRHKPLGLIHPAAKGAARAAVCAETFDRFGRMHDRLFRTTEWQERRDWIAQAAAVGIADTAAFRTCLESESTTRRLARDSALADQFRVRATPTFVGRGGAYTGLPDRADLESIILHPGDAP